MSGLCGICEINRELGGDSIAPMLAATMLPGESYQDYQGGRSWVCGVSRRWPFQQVGRIDGVRIGADADLCNVTDLIQAVEQENRDASRMSLAEQLGWLYRRRGCNFVSHLDGVFAIAIWDEGQQRLLLATDRLGVKRLYVCEEDGRLLFASRIGAIAAVAARPVEVNAAALMQFLVFSVVPAPLTIYRGVERLRPGSLLVYENHQVRQKRYWDLNYPENESKDEACWVDLVRERLRSAVHRHLEGCAPETTGAYLSGGTDSSSVVAFMSERFPEVNTFSIDFPDPRFSERRFARTTATHFHTRHHERCVKPQDAMEATERIFQYYDEPFANPSAIGAYYCARLASESGIDTLLAGEGGDEFFAGNTHYLRDKYFALYHSLPGWLRRTWIEPCTRILPRNGAWRSLPRRFVRRAHISNPRRVFSYDFLLNQVPEEVCEADFLRQVHPDTWLEIAEGHFQNAPAHTDLNRLLYLDVKLTLPDNDILKVAGTAESAGVRVRFPLLDYHLAELAGRIPSGLKVKGFQMRYVFKQAMNEILPHEVLYKKKQGFGVPIGSWLLQDPGLNSWMHDVLGDPRARRRGYIRPEFLDQLLGARFAGEPESYGKFVWKLLALEYWFRQHFESRGARKGLE